jgi:hypothetical protein
VFGSWFLSGTNVGKHNQQSCNSTIWVLYGFYVGFTFNKVHKIKEARQVGFYLGPMWANTISKVIIQPYGYYMVFMWAFNKVHKIKEARQDVKTTLDEFSAFSKMWIRHLSLRSQNE